MTIVYYWTIVTFDDQKWTRNFDWKPLYAFVKYKLEMKKMVPKETHLRFDDNTAAQIFLGPFDSRKEAEIISSKLNNHQIYCDNTRVRVHIERDYCLNC